MLLTAEFDYYLPPELIAQRPVAKRDESRLMVLHRTTQRIQHRIFKDILEYLNPGDLLVLNNTKVIPARLIGRKETGGKVEVFLAKEVEKDLWEVLVDVGRGLKIEKSILFGEELKAAVITEPQEGGLTKLRFEYEGDFKEILKRLGEIPLPPYIKNPKSQIPNPNKIPNSKSQRLKDRYQTVYAQVPGATAAPTAGLHFTPHLLGEIKAKGIEIAFITLHTGYATFRPVTAERVENHKMYKEYFEISKQAAEKINEVKGKIITVGTTTLRALESVADEKGKVKPYKGETDLFIYPGYKFKAVHTMVTNFHLPKSTLLMLVSAFAGGEFIKKAYEEAIKKKYRFYSFGDAMLII